MTAIWIGLAHVMSPDGLDELNGARGAFVNAVGPAESSGEFESALRQLLADSGLVVVEVEDIELLSDRLLRHTLDGDVQRTADVSIATGTIQCSDFYTYKESDDEM